MPSHNTSSILSHDSQSPSSQSFSFAPWPETSNSDLSSPLDEFAAETGRLSNLPGPNNIGAIEAISPVFIGMVGHEYNLTEVQISNIRALYHVHIQQCF